MRGDELVGVVKDTDSESKNQPAQRSNVVAGARDRHIPAVLVTELTRQRRSTTELLRSLRALGARGVSVIAQTGFAV